MPDLEFPTRRGDLRAYLATPDGAGAWPGVVVIHEAFGLDDDIRCIADRFAANGYAALAPDFFSWGRRFACMRAAFRELRGGTGRMGADIQAARAWLAERPDSTGRVGVIGFCMGGGFALLAAPGGGFVVASVNYGQVPEDAERVLAGSCPIVGSYGGRDRFLRGQPERLDRALTELQVEHDLKIYPGAGHGFMNHHTQLLPLILDRVMGNGYRGPAAEDAWSRILSFFDTHLRGMAAS